MRRVRHEMSLTLPLPLGFDLFHELFVPFYIPLLPA